jgi:hypothetical protein
MLGIYGWNLVATIIAIGLTPFVLYGLWILRHREELAVIPQDSKRFEWLNRFWYDKDYQRIEERLPREQACYIQWVAIPLSLGMLTLVTLYEYVKAIFVIILRVLAIPFGFWPKSLNPSASYRTFHYKETPFGWKTPIAGWEVVVTFLLGYSLFYLAIDSPATGTTVAKWAGGVVGIIAALVVVTLLLTGELATPAIKRRRENFFSWWHEQCPQVRYVPQARQNEGTQLSHGTTE